MIRLHAQQAAIDSDLPQIHRGSLDLLLLDAHDPPHEISIYLRRRIYKRYVEWVLLFQSGTMTALSTRSRVSLNFVNFFLAEIGAMVIPYLNVYLRGLGWRYDQIGLAIAAAGLGSLIFQIPAGWICDHSKDPRRLLAFSSLGLGLIFLILPRLADSRILETAALFFSGIPGAFFMPLLGSLALALSSREHLPEVLGENQGWSHAGNLTAALAALAVVHAFGLSWLFFVAAGAAFIAAIGVMAIPRREVRQVARLAGEDPGLSQMMRQLWKLLRDPKVRTLLLSVILFHVANGPMLSNVSLYLKHLGGSDGQVAWLVMITQMVSIPAAWLAGRTAVHSGRRFMFGAALILFPLRILLYLLATTPGTVLAITALDGVISSIMSLVVVLICSDLAKKGEAFNSLMGLIYTAPSLGAIIGSSVQGLVTENYGFSTYVHRICGDRRELGRGLFALYARNLPPEAVARNEKRRHS